MKSARVARRPEHFDCLLSIVHRRETMLTILAGPARSGKTEQLLRRYRAVLGQWPPAAALWLAPTWRAATEVRQRLFDGTFRGCFQPAVLTFEKFAETILHAAGLPIRPVARLMKRELIRQIIDQQSALGRLTHFQSIAATGGLVDLICEFIGELKRLEIWPEEFHRACSTRGIGNKDVELSEIYAAYQQALREHGLFDAEGRFWWARDVLQKGEGGRGKGEKNEELSILVLLPPSAFRLPPFLTSSSSTGLPTSRGRSTRSLNFSQAARKLQSSRCHWNRNRDEPTCFPSRSGRWPNFVAGIPG